jgi:hypothetical protein
MTGTTVRESVKVAGLAERTRIVRSFVFPVKKKMGHFVARCPG